MATAKWGTPLTASGNIAGASLDGLTAGSTSAFVTLDNASDKALYALVEIVLGNFTAVAPASITLRVHYVGPSGTIPNDTGSLGGGSEIATVPVTTGASIKRVTVPIRLLPFSARFQVTNNAGGNFAGSGNSIDVQKFNEDVS